MTEKSCPASTSEDEAGVEAVFLTDASFPDLDDSLQPEDGALFVRRVLSRGDRSRCALQGLSIPL